MTRLSLLHISWFPWIFFVENQQANDTKSFRMHAISMTTKISPSTWDWLQIVDFLLLADFGASTILFIITLYEHFKRYFMDLVKHLWSKGWVYITWLAVTIWSLHYSACFMDHDIKGLVLCSVTMMEDIFRPKIFFLEPRHVLCLENGLGIAVVYLVATDPFANKKKSIKIVLFKK